MQKLLPNAPCLCGSGLKYKKCCRPWHQGRSPATPEQLMRARYVAYAIGRVDYVMATTHPDSPQRRPDNGRWQAELAAFSRHTNFLGLQVMSTKIEGECGWVTFQATLQQKGRDASFTEQSLFEKVDGQWLYKAAVTKENQ